MEILRTLDAMGCIDGMPFMPEMFEFCGKRLQVQKSVHKTYDTVFPSAVQKTRRHGASRHGVRRLQAAQVPHSAGESGPTYVCQATQLPYASKALSPFEPTQYIRDLTSGNVSLTRWLSGIVYITYQNLTNLGIGIGSMLRWLYDLFQSIRGGIPYPRRLGTIPLGEPTPTEMLNLQEGELMRVKGFRRSLGTCNVDNKNRGNGIRRGTGAILWWNVPGKAGSDENTELANR